MNLMPGIFYSAFENKDYVHNVDNQNDCIFNEIVFDILDYCKKNLNCSVEDICKNFAGIYEVADAQNFQNDIQKFIDELLNEKILYRRSIAMRETESNYFTNLSDIFLYIYSIKIHSLQEEFFGKFRAAFEKKFAAVMEQVKIQFWFTTSSLNANAIFKVLIFLLGGLDVLRGEMTIGNFVALNGYYNFAMQGVSYFMKIGQNYQNSLSAYNRILEIKNLPEEKSGTKILTEVILIEVKNLSYGFDDREILKNFSKKFERGKIYCITGKNGAGKLSEEKFFMTEF